MKHETLSFSKDWSGVVEPPLTATPPPSPRQSPLALETLPTHSKNDSADVFICEYITPTMHSKTLFVVLIAFLVLNTAEGKKSRRNKQPKEEEDTTLQPSVVSYSTFGFNDVGTYDGFVPSSPDYANYLTTVNQESANTRLYAPAFPTALDNTGFDGSFGSQSHGYSVNDPDNGQQASMFSQNANLFNMPSFDSNGNQNSKVSFLETYGRDGDENDAPVYGTKLGSRGKKHTNFTEQNVPNTLNGGNPSAVSMNFNFQDDSQFEHDVKLSHGESNNNYQNVQTIPPIYPSADIEAFAELGPNSGQLKFPKVIDFTKMNYPTELENKYLHSSYNPMKSLQNDKKYKSSYDDLSSKYMQHTSMFKHALNIGSKNIDENNEKQSSSSPESNFINVPPAKSIFKGTPFKSDQKENKNKHVLSNHSNDLKHWEEPTKGYKYATNYSSTSFKFDIDDTKKQMMNNFKFDLDEPKKQSSSIYDEVVPASSNVVDLNHYQIPETDLYSSFKKMPEIKPVYENEYDSPPTKAKKKPDEYFTQIKSAYNDGPTLTTQWGNIFKSTGYSSHKNHPRKPVYAEEASSDIVHIPKRPQSSKYHYGKHSEISSSDINDWPSYSRRPTTKNRPTKDFYKDVYNTKFKTEEDLLDLRNHDTSNPSYLPTYRPTDNELSNENDYKKLVEKWRQSYWRAKFRDSYPEIEAYSSETKPLHVPIPKPYPIEVPHPVIVPVPQPYPVRVPVPKPVAVPVIRELTVAVEKPVPYPVIKNVPYPVEKPVPVPVEKEVAVPVEKPYPVHIPHVRPVFHHSRPPRDEIEDAVDDEDDYFPRPEGGKKAVVFKKRPKSTRNRQHRPTRMTYQDRNSRRAPRRPTESHGRRPYSTRLGFHYSLPSRFRDYELEYESEPSELVSSYCKRTGNC